jgi:hypothetical protein
MSLKDSHVHDVTLMSCLLFICVELAQQNYITAIQHLKNGLRILHDALSQAVPENQQWHSSNSKLDSYHMKTILRQLFTRIIIQTLFFGTPYGSGPSLYHEPTRHARFAAICEAREALDNRFVGVYLFVRATSKQILPHSDAVIAQQEELKLELRNWHSLFLDFIRNNRPNFSSKDSTGAILLQMHYISLSIILSTALDPSTAAFALFTPSFARIIAFAQSILDPSSSNSTASTTTAPSSLPAPTPSSSSLPNFSFDMGIIPPLFYTATKSRSRTHRWRAVALLQRAPYREGIWGAAMTARMAQRIVEIEEDAAAAMDPERMPFLEMDRRGMDAGADAADWGICSADDAFEPGGTGSVPMMGLARARPASALHAVQYWTVRFRRPPMYERAITVCIGGATGVGGRAGRDGATVLGTEEVVRW